MTDLVLLTLVTVYIVGMAAAALLGYMLGRRSAGPAVANACECGHSLGFHSPDDGECRAEYSRARYTEKGYRSGRQYVFCDCKQYVHPSPRPSGIKPVVTRMEK